MALTEAPVEVLERLPGILRDLSESWPWVILVVAFVFVVRFALVPIVQAWKGRQ